MSDQKPPATSEQLTQIYKLGYVGARPATKQEASELISKLLKSKRVKPYLFSTENGSEPYLVPMDKWPDPYKNDTEFRKELLKDWEKSEKRKEKLSNLRDL
ncbi:MAG: hypothetical protein EPO62_03770 [Candidatus Nitrosotenuis sp.]|nr:MAG: hypothetical protein EPO62_03770 [Candidatus Nitrosotenuis sp.]